MKKSIYPFVFFGMVALCFIACEKVEEDGFPEDQLIERKDFVLTRSELDFRITTISPSSFSSGWPKMRKEGAS